MITKENIEDRKKVIANDTQTLNTVAGTTSGSVTTGLVSLACAS